MQFGEEYTAPVSIPFLDEFRREIFPSVVNIISLASSRIRPVTLVRNVSRDLGQEAFKEYKCLSGTETFMNISRCHSVKE
jgi:hypothetical protein